jgi:hypothetical protein
MVLQRDAPALVYGFAPPGTTVFTNMTQAGSGVSYALQTQATGDGLWRQLLPAQAASRVDGADAWAFSFTSDAGDGAHMDDVLFGDVHVCAGQSNMQFTLTLGANSSAECAAAGLPAYAGMRVMSIYDNRSATPREYIYPEYLLPWSVASEDSICPGGWGYMSAVCWYTYRGVYEALGVPQGLISNSFGGSRIEEWSSPEALGACPAIVPPPPGQNLYASAIWNVMMTPFTVGPMGMRTSLFYQGGEQKGERARVCAPTPLDYAHARTYPRALPPRPRFTRRGQYCQRLFDGGARMVRLRGAGAYPRLAPQAAEPRDLRRLPARRLRGAVLPGRRKRLRHAPGAAGAAGPRGQVRLCERRGPGELQRPG